jgi:hypothetical protein
LPCSVVGLAVSAMMQIASATDIACISGASAACRWQRGVATEGFAGLSMLHMLKSRNRHT